MCTFFNVVGWLFILILLGTTAVVLASIYETISRVGVVCLDVGVVCLDVGVAVVCKCSCWLLLGR